MASTLKSFEVTTTRGIVHVDVDTANRDLTDEQLEAEAFSIAKDVGGGVPLSAKATSKAAAKNAAAKDEAE